MSTHRICCVSVASLASMALAQCTSSCSMHPALLRFPSEILLLAVVGVVVPGHGRGVPTSRRRPSPSPWAALLGTWWPWWWWWWWRGGAVTAAWVNCIM